MNFLRKIFVILSLAALLIYPITSSLAHDYAERDFRVGMIAFDKPFLEVCDGLVDGLEQFGFQRDGNIHYEIHHVDKNISKIPDILDSFAKNHIDLIFTVTTPVALAVKKKAEELNIPVIFTVVADPVGSKIVPSLQASGCAMSGISHIAFELLPKRLLLFKEAFPGLRRVAIFYNPQEKWLRENVNSPALHAAAAEAGIKFVEFHIKNEEEMDRICRSISSKDIDGLFMIPDPLAASLFGRIVKLSRREKLPLMVIDNMFLKKGGVLGYSPAFYDVGFQAASMVHSVFHGIQAGQLPVQNPDKVRLVVSLKEIQRLELDISDTFLSKADEIIH